MNRRSLPGFLRKERRVGELKRLKKYGKTAVVIPESTRGRPVKGG